MLVNDGDSMLDCSFKFGRDKHASIHSKIISSNCRQLFEILLLLLHVTTIVVHSPSRTCGSAADSQSCEPGIESIKSAPRLAFSPATVGDHRLLTGFDLCSPDRD